jgi:hypothetical protein
VAGADEEVGPPLTGTELTVLFSCHRLQSTDDGGAHGHDPVATLTGLPDRRRRGLRQLEPLGIHPMFVHPVGRDRLEGSHPHMEGNLGHTDTHLLQLLE